MSVDSSNPAQSSQLRTLTSGQMAWYRFTRNPAAMIGAQLGFKPGHIEDSAAYVQSWLQVLRNDKRAIVKAAAAAQRSADYLMEQVGESAEAA